MANHIPTFERIEEILKECKIKNDFSTHIDGDNIVIHCSNRQSKGIIAKLDKCGYKGEVVYYRDYVGVSFKDKAKEVAEND